MVIDGGATRSPSYTPSRSFHRIKKAVRALVETFPTLSRLKTLRP